MADRLKIIHNFQILGFSNSQILQACIWRCWVLWSILVKVKIHISNRISILPFYSISNSHNFRCNWILLRKIIRRPKSRICKDACYSYFWDCIFRIYKLRYIINIRKIFLFPCLSFFPLLALLSFLSLLPFLRSHLVLTII